MPTKRRFTHGGRVDTRDTGPFSTASWGTADPVRPINEYQLTEPAFLVALSDGIGMVCTACAQQVPQTEPHTETTFVYPPQCDSCHRIMRHTGRYAPQQKTE